MVALKIEVGPSGALVDRTIYSGLDDLHIFASAVENAEHADCVMSVYDLSWCPRAGNVIKVSHGATVHYGGIITDVDEDQVNPNHMKYRLTCKGFETLFDRRLVARNYASQAASAIVLDFVAAFTSGFTTTHVQASPPVASQKFDYKYPTEIMRTLADTLGWGWHIDYSQDVHFAPFEISPAPIALLDADADLVNYGDLRLKESALQVKTRVYVKGFDVRSSVPYGQTFKGDGITKFFNFGYEFSDVGDVVATRNGGAITALTDTIDGQAGVPQFADADHAFFCYSNLGFRFDVAPGNGDTIVVTSPYMTPGFTMVEDPDAQAFMAAREGGDGVHEAVIDDPNLTTNLVSGDDLAQQRGNILLARVALPRLTGTFSSYTQGWDAGQVFTLTSAKRMGGINQKMYVQECEKTLTSSDSTGPTWHYGLSIADSPLGI